MDEPATATSEGLSSSVQGGVATLTLDRPERRNAFSVGMLGSLLSELDRLREDDRVRVVVLRGAGDDFSVGGDLSSGAGGGVDTGVPAQVTSALRSWMRISQTLHDMPQVTIAAIDGACGGAGLSLACACDLRFCSDRARFATGFVKAGVSGDFGGTWTLSRIVGPAKARELYLLGAKFGADEATAMGLVTEAFGAYELHARVGAIADELATRRAPMALRLAKANLNDAERLSFAEALDREAERHVACSFSADALEAATAFMEKRDPDFTRG